MPKSEIRHQARTKHRRRRCRKWPNKCPLSASTIQMSLQTIFGSDAVIFLFRKGSDTAMLRMFRQIIIRTIQRNEARVQIIRAHRLIADGRNHVHEQIPFIRIRAIIVMVCKHRRPLHASRIAVRHITGTDMFLHAGPLRIRLPPMTASGGVHPNDHCRKSCLW